MILPVLLICQKQTQTYFYKINAVKKLQSLTVQIYIFIAQAYYQLFSFWQPIFIAANIYYPNNSKFTIHRDQNFHVLACHEPSNQQFYKEMSSAKKREILEELKSEYREILIDYFISDQNTKTKIDKFISNLFYANIPVVEIIEIHMAIIDEFSKQLKLEGRSDETLLDYRLTLIDVLANLCEAYRSKNSKKN
ncbi:MAG: KaiA family protein [Sphaerospermopsis sp. SIO1G2]|nr:KaiA family protein [Sphaerospermopsis sp. SIO1G1]NET72864.1 KaiA family protein [Sphaerospermopsis sp. SIO1G2]